MPETTTSACRKHIEAYLKAAKAAARDQGELVPRVREAQIRVQAERAAGLVELLDGPGSAILGDPVGTGKTPIALAAAAVLLSRGIHHVLIVAPNQRVECQWYERARWMGLTHVSKLSGKTSSRLKGTLYVATRRNMPNRPPNDPPMTLIIVDEAHRGLQEEKNSIFQEMENLARGCRLLLVTATPFQLSTDGLLSMLRISRDLDPEHKIALEGYGAAVNRLLMRWNRTEDSTDQAVLDAANDAQRTRPGAEKALQRHMLKTLDLKSIGMSKHPKPKETEIRVPHAWGVAYQAARIVPEFTSATDDDGRPSGTGKGDMFQRELISSSEAFWASKGGEMFEKMCRRGKPKALLDCLKKRLGQGADHPKVRATRDWVVDRVQEGRHVLVYCIFKRTQEAICAALLEKLSANAVAAPEDHNHLAHELRERFRDGSRKSKPLVLIVRDNLSESIDLDGGRPCLVHHDLAWNPVRLTQRIGRISRISSGFQKIKQRDIFVPCLNIAVDKRLTETVLGRAEMANLVLLNAAADRKDGGWVLPPEVLDILHPS